MLTSTSTVLRSTSTTSISRASTALLGGPERSRVVLGWQVASRNAVDATYDEMTTAGYAGVQVPYDAFWGARYAIVADPDGNHVGIMSPSDESRKYWPPTPTPAPAGPR